MPKEIEAQYIFVPALGIFLGVALVIIDSTLVNVALPVMARELHISDGAATWFVQAYQIVLLTLLFPAIALSPLVGCKRFFLCGIALFVAASLGCALSRTPGSLCLFRILQAVGGSAMLSVNIALVERVFKKGRLATGIGFNTATISISIIIGPALGGFMLTHVSWPWLFAINLPLGLLALLAAWKHVPGEQHTRLAREHLREFAVILGLSILLFTGFLASLGVFSWGLPWQIHTASPFVWCKAPRTTATRWQSRSLSGACPLEQALFVLSSCHNCLFHGPVGNSSCHALCLHGGTGL